MTFWVAGATVGVGVVGGMMQGDAAKKAAKTQSQATRYAADLQNEQFNRQMEMQQPWVDAGRNALTKLQGLTEYTPFGMSQFKQDPGYSFRLQQGQKALENSAAARGGLLSGATLRGASRYGQDMASQEYSNAFNRYQTERNAQLQPLQSLAGLGQSTTQQLGQAGQNMANNVGELTTSGAAARASGYVGQANALTNALNTGLNFYQNQKYVNKLGG